MRLKYEVMMDDLVAFNRYYWRNSPVMRGIRIRSAVIVLAALASAGALMSLNAGSRSALYATLALSVVFSLAYLHFSATPNRGYIRRMYAEGRNKGTLGEHEMEILPDGICERTSVGESKVLFQGVERIAVTDAVVLIFIGANMAHILPRNRVSEGDLDAFLSELRQKTPGATWVESPGG